MTSPPDPRAGSFPSYPAAGGQVPPPGSEPSAPPRPWPVLVAFWLAVCTPVLTTVLSVFSLASMWSASHSMVADAPMPPPRLGEQVDVAKVHETLDVLMQLVSGAALFCYVVLTVLWIVFGWQLRRGRQWARVVLVIFAVLWALSGLGLLIESGVDTTTPVPTDLWVWGVVTNALPLVAMVAFVVLVFLPSSNAYFRMAGRPRVASTVGSPTGW